jgi:hypothetical protein
MALQEAGEPLGLREIRIRVRGCPPGSSLAASLHYLVGAGIVERHGPRRRYTYLVTQQQDVWLRLYLVQRGWVTRRGVSI